MKQPLRQDIVDLIIADNYQYISAKYFRKDEEIKNIDKYLTKVIRAREGYICVDSDLKEIKTLIMNFSDENKLWPELPLVKKARQLGPINEKITLPFSLTRKQLIIINRLLFHPEDERMFITTGKGQTGKSTFLNIIKQLFNNDYSSASVGDLSNGFIVAEAVKHRLICSDELGKGDLDTKILKQLASKQPLTINPKNSPPHEIISQSALFWCCNLVPKIDASDSGLLRRIVYYERNTKINNPDPTLNKKIFTEDELLLIARRALAYDSPTWFDEFKKETYLNIMKNNSVYLTWEAINYSDYRELCLKKGLKAYSEPNYYTLKNLFTDWINEIKDPMDPDVFI